MSHDFALRAVAPLDAFPDAEGSGEESGAQIMALSVAPIYDRRLLPEEEPAVIDGRYSKDWKRCRLACSTRVSRVFA